MTQGCSDSVSFLELERDVLGELGAKQSSQLRAHLGGCALCRARQQHIAADNIVLRSLPRELPVQAGVASDRVSRPLRRTLGWAGSALAVAAALVLMFESSLHAPQVLPARKMIKGGSLALMLVRERGATVTFDPQQYRDGDHFKVLLTCPLRSRVHWDVAVFQAGATFFPFSPSTAIDCGNQVILDGAFTLTGNEPVSICVSIDEDRLIDRPALVSRGSIALKLSSVCTLLDPER